MPLIRTFYIVLTLSLLSLTFTACTTTTDPDDSGAANTGSLVYDVPASDNTISTYSFSSQNESIAFKNGRCPSWMPSGEILYVEGGSFSAGISWKIVTIAANGTNKHILLDSKLYDYNGCEKQPKLSRDGKNICFNYWFNDLGASELYSGHSTFLMKSDGTLIGAIDSLFDGSWMPDGSLVLSATIDDFWKERTYYAEGLYLLSSDMSKITSIGSGLIKPKHPAVSPDGKRIAFSMNSHIWMINADGSALRQVTTGSKVETHPCWSPDGKTIACVSYGSFEVTSFNALAALPADEANPIDLPNDSKYWVRDPSQSFSNSLGRLNPSTSISWK